MQNKMPFPGKDFKVDFAEMDHGETCNLLADGHKFLFAVPGDHAERIIAFLQDEGVEHVPARARFSRNYITCREYGAFVKTEDARRVANALNAPFVDFIKVHGLGD